jgi:hypothetical protein
VITVNASYAFHEYLPQLDSEAKIKKYFKEHMKSDADFKNKVHIEQFAGTFANLMCAISRIDDNEYPGSEIIGNRLENCDEKMVPLKAECMAHYDIFSFCGDNLDNYILYRGLGGKAFDMMTTAQSLGQPISITASEPQTQTQSENTMPEIESRDKYVGSLSIDSLKEQFGNRSK